ncbi:hypothetical protein PFICI_08158 [Pestalotiopsis fici W106-1]|uniref:Transcription factor domain-containing protein n=1 Tax=Pestalotiopsis fici (strain W106-1 / CGMCC3.15140) TaxID=1229662 RepID=W3X3P8_PESFW|nr:uncharacterized protein PFICI_08158 [Pestalotiopsis fici W106-1]ETS80629.1 hypothetical protein PFICI_08158 [Pestalotiopsis fici W106-1]
MSHFSTETVYTFSSYPSLIEAWQTTITIDAASHPFLLHGMLAISALHLASKRKPHEPPQSPTSASRSQTTAQNFTHDDYMRAFTYHQDQAMPVYRSLLQQALDLDHNEEFAVHSKQSWPAGPVYAMAVLTAFIATASISDNSPSLGTEKTQGDEGDQPHEERRHSHTTLVHPPPTLSSSISRPVSPETPAESARSETIFSNLLSLFINTRGTRVIAKAGLDMGAFQTTAYRHLITSSTSADEVQFPLPSSSRDSRREWYATLRKQMLDDVFDADDSDGDAGNVNEKGGKERELCAAALVCLEDVHSGAVRLLEAKKERLWHLRQRRQDPRPIKHDFVWLFKWTAIVSQEFLALVRERRPPAMVVLAQFMAICSLFEEEWYVEGWVRNAMEAVEHVLSENKGESEGENNEKARKWVSSIAERWIGTRDDMNEAGVGE